MKVINITHQGQSLNSSK